MPRNSPASSVSVRMYRTATACILLAVAVSRAEEPNEMIDSYFTMLHTSLEATAQSSELSTPTAERSLRQLIQRFPVIQNVVYASSSGKVAAEAAIRGASKPGRSVGNQAWFEATAKKNTGYYSTLRGADGLPTLFWAVPAAIKGKAAGAVAIKLNLLAALENASASVSVPIQITLGSDILYAKQWSEDPAAVSFPLNIAGLQDVSIRFAKRAASAAQQPSQPDTVASAAPLSIPTQLDDQARKTGTLLLAVFGGIAFGLIIVLVLVVKQNRRRTAVLPDDLIAGAGGTPRKPTTTSMAAISPRQTSAHKLPPPQTERFAVPPPEMVEQARAKMRDTVPAPKTAPPPPVHRGRPETATLAGSVPVIPPEMYERIQAQVAGEVARQLKAEFEQERKRLTIKAEVFNRTVQAQLSELVEKLSAAEGHFSETASALKNSAFKLTQALDGLNQKANGSDS